MKQPENRGPEWEYTTITATRRSQLVPVDQPMVLITQAPRSGGTMLMHLLDGHPECHVFPVECRIRFGRHFNDATQGDPWSLLNDDEFERQFARGVPHARRELHGDQTRHPLLLPPSLHRQLFDDLAAGASSERDLLDAYLTSFFNAWLDNQNLYGPQPKKWVVAFTSRMLVRELKMAHFRELYPDGKVISVIRDPLTWFCSARRWSSRMEWADLSTAMDFWEESAEEMLRRKEVDGDAMLVLSFEDLITDTRGTTDLLARYLEIRRDPGLLKPSFNRLPVRANSSFNAGKARVNSEPLQRHDELTPAEDAFIRERNWELYERVLAIATRPDKLPRGSKAASLR